MTRTRAFLIHLGISVLIYLVLLYLIVFIWYPQPFFAADGGWQGVRLVTGIDLVLGPVLTLIVFKAGKPGLKFDLALIGMLQALALSWGVWTVYDQRTDLVVFANGAFYTLNPEQVATAGAAAQRIISQADTRPPYAFVSLPAGKAEKKAVIRSLFAGKPLFLHGELYAPLTPENRRKIPAQSPPLEQLLSLSPGNRQALNDFLQRRHGKVDDYAFLPLHCRYDHLVMVVDRKDGRFITSLNMDTAQLY
jgi:hypothetical protein